MCVEIVVAAAELCPPFRENRLVSLGSLQGWLMRIRPKHAARDFADVAKRTPVVAGGIFPPTRNGKVFPATVAATRVGDHHVVTAIRQQLHFRRWRVRAGQYAHWHF